MPMNMSCSPYSPFPVLKNPERVFALSGLAAARIACSMSCAVCMIEDVEFYLRKVLSLFASKIFIC